MVERTDVEAAVEARRELGREYEPELIEGFLAKIEQRLDERKRPRPERAGPEHQGAITPLILGSIGCGVAATAIASGNHQGWIAVIAWIAIAISNVAVAYFRR